MRSIRPHIIVLYDRRFSRELMSQPRIAILLAALHMGGAERAILTIAEELVRQGYQVDLLLAKKKGELLSEVPDCINLKELGRTRGLRLVPTLQHLGGLGLARLALSKLPSVVTSLPFLVAYLNEARPQALLATLRANNLVALWAKALSKSSSRVVIREASTMSIDQIDRTSGFDKLFPDLARRWYPAADGIVAVSNGVADDLSEFVDVARNRITTIYGAVDVDRIRRLMCEPVNDPWIKSDGSPLVVSVGRLEAAKDLPTLLRAFAKVRAKRPCRLLIIGEGGLRAELESMRDSLGLSDCVRLPGSDANPFRHVARASVFVLSSAWEGFPNALLEALACGCPVISTDCRSGPAEILENGAYGPLVKVGDADALANTIHRVLEAPGVGREGLLNRARFFTPENTTRRYLKILLPTERQSS